MLGSLHAVRRRLPAWLGGFRRRVGTMTMSVAADEDPAVILSVLSRALLADGGPTEVIVRDDEVPAPVARTGAAHARRWRKTYRRVVRRIKESDPPGEPATDFRVNGVDLIARCDSRTEIRISRAPSRREY